MDNIKYAFVLFFASWLSIAFAQDIEAQDIGAPPVEEAPPPPPAIKQCAKTYNINELAFKLKNGFPVKLKDCASKLTKEMALAAMPFGKKSAPVEPKSFMKQCSVDGIKNEIPNGFPGTDKVLGSLDNFMQNIMNAASAGGALDPKKLASSVASIDTSINSLLSDVKKLASGECVVDEPYNPPVAQLSNNNQDNKGSNSEKDLEKDLESDSEDDSDGKKEKGILSFGIRAGFNFSHIYAEYGNNHQGTYESIGGMQTGVVFDIATTIDWLHLQPGVMYVQKGMKNNGTSVTSHYVDIPLLISLKLSVLRINAGTYFGILYSDGDDNDIFKNDFGVSTGIGFDIDMFYIGMIYDYGLTNMSKINYLSSFNRTIGFNLGINL